MDVLQEVLMKVVAGVWEKSVHQEKNPLETHLPRNFCHTRQDILSAPGPDVSLLNKPLTQFLHHPTL